MLSASVKMTKYRDIIVRVACNNPQQFEIFFSKTLKQKKDTQLFFNHLKRTSLKCAVFFVKFGNIKKKYIFCLVRII